MSVTVYVTDGKKIAKRTLNERVGIMNGLSILGTSGIVKPYSSSSYIASIEQGIDVAVANNIKELVINSGARSENIYETNSTIYLNMLLSITEIGLGKPLLKLMILLLKK